MSKNVSMRTLWKLKDVHFYVAYTKSKPHLVRNTEFYLHKPMILKQGDCAQFCCRQQSKPWNWNWKTFIFYTNLWYWNKEIMFRSTVDNTPNHVSVTWKKHTVFMTDTTWFQYSQALLINTSLSPTPHEGNTKTLCYSPSQTQTLHF